MLLFQDYDKRWGPKPWMFPSPSHLTDNLSADVVSSTFKMYPESDLFSPARLRHPSQQNLLPIELQLPPNVFLCFRPRLMTAYFL